MGYIKSRRVGEEGEQRRKVRVRHHPENLSRIYAPADSRNYVEARYADLRRPAILLWEQRAAAKRRASVASPRPLVSRRSGTCGRPSIARRET